MFVADLIGVAVFAASGATAAVAKRLDMFGVAVIAMVTALGGGAIRDVLIGATPPLLLSDWRYPTCAFLVAVVVFFFHAPLSRLQRSMLVLDAAGLALFAVIGTLKGLEFGLTGFAACFVGVISGVGGGLLRDILTGEIPVILRSDLYAVAALTGSVIVVLGTKVDPTYELLTALLAGLIIFTIRLVAIRYKWEAPKPKI